MPAIRFPSAASLLLEHLTLRSGRKSTTIRDVLEQVQKDRSLTTNFINRLN